MNCVVLVVEDDPLVRMRTVVIAEETADRVYEAENADAAILVLEAQSDITRLFTDVDMRSAGSSPTYRPGASLRGPKSLALARSS